MSAHPDTVDDGVGWYDAPWFDIAADPTGREPEIRLNASSEDALTRMTPQDARRLAAALSAAADYADGLTTEEDS